MSNISLYWFQKEAKRRVEEAWGEGKKSLLISVPTGGGKCVSSDMLIWTNNGVFEIGDLAKGVPANTALYRRNMDVETRKGSRNCALIYRSALTSTLKLKTGLGYEIAGTPEHPVLVLAADGSLKMRNLEDTKAGDTVVLKKDNKLWADLTDLPLKSLGAEANAAFYMKKVMREVCSLGRYLGSNDRERSLISREDKNHARLFVRRDDEIPAVILRGGRDFAAVFLGAMFARNRKTGSIEFITPHEKLSKHVQVLLLSLGIPAVRNFYSTAASTDTVTYRISIPGDFVPLFKRVTGFNGGAAHEENGHGRAVKGYSGEITVRKNLLFEKVVSVEPGFDDVFDLTVPDGHEFVANGFVVHNTIIFSSILKDVLQKDNRRGLILVHRDSLLTQAEEKLKFVWPGVKTGRLQGGVYQFDGQVTIASVPTLAGKLEEFAESCRTLGPVDYVVCDEAHHAYASSWRKILNFMKANYDSRFLGVTATPIRTDSKESLTEIFADVPYVVSIFQLIQEGFLSPLSGYSIETDLDLKGVHRKGGDYDVKELSERIRHSEFDKTIAQKWKDMALDRKTIAFAVDIRHVESLTEQFRRVGARVIGIHGSLPREEQRKILAEFSGNKYNVLVNCMLLTEGFDEPSVDCVLMARPTSSRSLFVQMLGRGLRLSPGKKNCILIDFVGNSDSNELITMQDLLGFYGLKRAERLFKEKNLREKEDALKENGIGNEPFVISPETIPQLQAIDVFGKEFETSVASKEIDVFNINSFAWGEIGDDLFVTVRRNLSLAICANVPGDGQKKFIPYLVHNGECEKWICRLSEPVEKEFALAIANVQLFDYGDRNLASSSAAWRDDVPTESQKKILMNAIQRHNRSAGKPISFNEIPEKKGKYSSMITALFTYGYIQSNGMKKVTRDEAVDFLKKLIIADMGAADDGNRKIDINMSTLQIEGEATEEDRATFMEMLLALQKMKHSDFHIAFLMQNPVIFSGDVIRVYRRNYPSNPLTDKQKAFLMDKISLVVRLHYRDRRFEIVEPKIKKGDAEGENRLHC
ncbi:MAG TPA: hypothetical protein DEP53_06520 [Bacteroidetes bacterium]|nr:MAG: hypothetical protein A2W80_15830 [Candidatus Riflebacteria bacterium GWC2_50_8]HCA79374.1 hypothetical protein [Bacteroidota bacterium]